MGRDQAPHDLLHHVGLHVAEKQLLLGLLGDDLRVVEAHVAGEDDLARGEENLRRRRIGHAESDAIAQAELVHLARGGERQHGLVALLVGKGEHRLRLLRAVDEARLARSADVAPELDRERAGAGDVERLERQRRLPAKLKAAPREERGGGDEDGAHHTTTLTRRPGTTITFLTGLPSANLTTASCASASCSICSFVAALGARTWPRSLPFTWRTSSISSVSSAAPSTDGQGAAPTSPAYPSSPHSPLQICGAIG